MKKDEDFMFYKYEEWSKFVCILKNVSKYVP